MMYKIYNKKIKKSIALCILNIKNRNNLTNIGDMIILSVW